MSGPIVRKYGFPNFEKIFGPKPVLHGADDEPKGEVKDPPAKEPARPEAGTPEGRATGETGPSR